MSKPILAQGALSLMSLILAAATYIPAMAAEPALQLSDAVNLSLQHNVELIAFREERGIRDAGIIRAGLLPNPTLDLEAATGSLTGSKNENSLALGLSQEFLLAGKRDKRISVAEFELDIYRLQLKDKERILREEVKTAFFDTLLAKERIALADRLVTLNRQLLTITKERLAAGDIPELEMNLSKVELARSEGIRIEAGKAMLLSQSKLLSLVGQPIGNQPEITGTLDTVSTPAFGTLTEMKQHAINNRPDLKTLQTEKKRGDADIVLAHAEKIPNLTAGLVFRRGTTSMEIAGQEGKDTAYTIGVKLSIPIPLFDRNRAGVQEATARKNSAESRLSGTLRTIEREIDAAYATLQKATSILSLYKGDIIPQLEENLKLTLEAYRLGEVGILAVIQEQKKFFEASDGHLAALRDRQVALVRLESAAATELTGGEN